MAEVEMTGYRRRRRVDGIYSTDAVAGKVVDPVFLPPRLESRLFHPRVVPSWQAHGPLPFLAGRRGRAQTKRPSSGEDEGRALAVPPHFAARCRTARSIPTNIGVRCNGRSRASLFPAEAGFFGSTLWATLRDALLWWLSTRPRARPRLLCQRLRRLLLPEGRALCWKVYSIRRRLSTPAWAIRTGVARPWASTMRDDAVQGRHAMHR
jgi:hypothetical protein